MVSSPYLRGRHETSGEKLNTMPTFLTREGIARHLHKIIEEATRELVLISAFIKVDDETKNLLRNKKHGTAIRVIYGKRRLRHEEKDFLDSLSIKAYFLKNLHAKCYLNEGQALVTSMNLHEFSLANNDEMGILVSRQDDPELYDAIYQEASRLQAASGETSTAVSRPKLKGAETRAQTTLSAEKKPRVGFCIRCGDDVAANPMRPYCRPCYYEDDEFDDEDYEYEEDYCHICGEEYPTTFSKPLCRSCYKKYKDVFQFATA